MMTRPEGDPDEMEYLETSLVLTGAGRVLAVMRTEKDGMFQAVSTDMGRTWGAPRRLPGLPPNMQPSLLRLSDGRLLLCYGHRRTIPRSIRVRLSDDGEIWGEPLILRDDLPNRDIGYPCSVEVGGGRMLTVYWYNLFNRYVIGGTFWTLPPAG